MLRCIIIMLCVDYTHSGSRTRGWQSQSDVGQRWGGVERELAHWTFPCSQPLKQIGLKPHSIVEKNSKTLSTHILHQSWKRLPNSCWSPLATFASHAGDTEHIYSHTHGYLSWAAGDGDPILTQNVTGAVVGGAWARAWRTVASRV